MVAHLTKSVLAGGRAFPAGTAREGEAAKVVPAGEWWSDFTTTGETPHEVQVEQATVEVEGQDEPGSTPGESWTNAEIKQYADDNGIDLGGATTKADMLAVIGG